jgi:hypothetical protein
MKQKNKNHKNEFDIPKGYFNDLEYQIFNKLTKEKNVSKEGFEIPDNYFDDFEQRLTNKLDNDSKKTTVFSLKRIIIKISIAASFLLLLGLGYKYFNNTSVDLNQIAMNDIEIWMDENIDYLDTNLISETLNINDLDNFHNFNETDIINQLDGIEIESILDEMEITY